MIGFSIGSAMVICKNMQKTPCISALNCMWLYEEGEGECVDLNEIAVGNILRIIQLSWGSLSD